MLGPPRQRQLSGPISVASRRPRSLACGARVAPCVLATLRRRIVPTVPRELRAELAHPFEADALGTLAIPALLLLAAELERFFHDA